jgi:hypothetical protein
VVPSVCMLAELEPSPKWLSATANQRIHCRGSAIAWKADGFSHCCNAMFQGPPPVVLTSVLCAFFYYIFVDMFLLW